MKFFRKSVLSTSTCLATAAFAAFGTAGAAQAQDAAPADSAADILIVFTPGIERFEYFRMGERLRRGEVDPLEILRTQERFDNHFVDSPLWRSSRITPPAGELPERG